MIVRKSPEDLEKMRRAGLLVWKVLAALEAMVEEGVTTLDLEKAAERMIREAGARPAFKGYHAGMAGAAYPFVLCASVNEEVVHGMPSARRALKKGDIVSIDTGVLLDGFYGDAAITVPVGDAGPEAARLIQVTREALDLGAAQMRPGNRLADVSGAIERHVVENGFSVVRAFVGHGIGSRLHEEPQVPNYVDRRGDNPRLKEGMVLAIEPMVNAGSGETRLLKDGWTAVTRDGSRSAHFEHCVAVTADGPWVLTRP